MAGKMINATKMKLVNRRRVLELLSLKPVSRAELARRTGMTRASISNIVDELLQEGWVNEGSVIAGGVGRNSTSVQLNPRAYRMGGITMDRHMCLVGVSDFAGNLLKVARVFQEPGCGRTELLERLENQLEELLRQLDEEDRAAGLTPPPLLGIGIASPGPLDSVGGYILDAVGFEGWSGISITAHVEKRFSCPAYLKNDANASALAERRHVIKKEDESFLELWVDEGLGSGVMMNGQLFDGCDRCGTELGHVTIRWDGPRCSCGNYGCAELYAAIPNIVKYAVTVRPDLDSWETIVDLAAAKDMDALGVMRKEAGYLTAVILNAVNVLDINKVILVGGITYKEKYICNMISQVMERRLSFSSRRQVEVSGAGLNGSKKILAGTNLVFEEYLAS